MRAIKVDKDNSLLFVGADNRPDILEYPQHYHGLFEIYYMENGSCQYFIDNCSYLVESGDIVLIPNGIIHNTKYSDNNFLRSLINCSKYFIPKSVVESISNFKYIYRNESIKPEVDNIFRSIKNDYENQDKFSTEALRSLIHLLFILLARNPNQKVNKVIKNKYVYKTIEYIKANFSSNVSLADAAKMCSVSQEHLSRIFKKETGYCFSEYLMSIRFKHAEHLLMNDNLSIIETANRCGFEDSNYFSFMFKKKHGVSPSEFKKNL